MLWLQIRNWLRRQEGQDLTEYALLGVLIAVVCVAVVGALGASISALWERIVENIASALGG